jgi:hypothetical protein
VARGGRSIFFFDLCFCCWINGEGNPRQTRGGLMFSTGRGYPSMCLSLAPESLITHSPSLSIYCLGKTNEMKSNNLIFSSLSYNENSSAI